MSKQDKNNTLQVTVFTGLICFGLWLTNPGDAIKDCEKVNKAKFCQILNVE